MIFNNLFNLKKQIFTLVNIIFTGNGFAFANLINYSWYREENLFNRTMTFCSFNIFKQNILFYNT